VRKGEERIRKICSSQRHIGTEESKEKGELGRASIQFSCHICCGCNSSSARIPAVLHSIVHLPPFLFPNYAGSSRGVGCTEVPFPATATSERGGPCLREGAIVVVLVGDQKLCEDGRWYYIQRFWEGSLVRGTRDCFGKRQAVHKCLRTRACVRIGTRRNVVWESASAGYVPLGALRALWGAH
jgi:hypothetical protein